VFERKYRAEMKAPDASRVLDLLAALSHQTDFAVGCYCEREERCHRSVLRALLEERGARFSGGNPNDRLIGAAGVAGGARGEVLRREPK
jgi:hypothetical protein